MLRDRHYIYPVPVCWVPVVIALLTASVRAQVNDWISANSGDWHNAANWSSGLPHFSHFEERITNVGSKAVAIQPTTPVNFSSSMTVQNLRVGGVPPGTNTLLLNFFGTTTPLRVLNDFNIEPNGRVLMLSSGLNVSNLNLHGTFDQDGGELVFSNSPASIMQIEGGRFNLTSGYVFGKNLYLGGTNEGHVNASGLVSVDWLVLGAKPTVPGSPGGGTYVLQSGWLIVGAHELVGFTGFGTLIQNGGTNSAPDLAVGNGNYEKKGGALFADEVRVISPVGTMTHAGGTATITNVLRLAGTSSSDIARFNMLGGSLSTPRILLEERAVFTQTNGAISARTELLIDNGRTGPSAYFLSGGNLFANNTIVASSPSTAFIQSGGTHIVTNTLHIANQTIYRLEGGTVTAPNIVLSGNFPDPPQFFVLSAPPYAITNESIGLGSGVIVIQDSAQQFGRLTIGLDAGINLAGASAILRFADSHTNKWESQLVWLTPRLMVFNWNGSTNGGGADQLFFGTNSSGLTASQLAQIDFINPAGFPPGTNHARILATGEIVPAPLPVLSFQNDGTNLVMTWPGSFILQSATNVVGPYFDVTNAVSPYTNSFATYPQQFFRLRN